MRIFLTILLSFTVYLSSVPKAQALVGLAISSRSAKSVGGIMSVAGVGGVATGVGLTALLGNSYTFLAISVLGATAGIIGIVVLDEKACDLKFSQLDAEKAKLLNISSSDLDIFNSEVEELNLLKGEIEAKITKKTTDKEIVEQWKNSKQYLSPETLKVAARIIQASVEAKK